MIYLELVWSFIQIGLFSIGGGYAALPLIQNQVVDLHHWMTMNEFADVITISNMTPGPIAINAATFVGMRLGGIPGAVVATLGCVLPSFVIVLTLALLYKKYKTLRAVDGILAGLRPAVVGMIAAAAVSILVLAVWGTGQVDWISIAILAVALLVLRMTKVSPTFVMLGCGLVGGIVYSFL